MAVNLPDLFDDKLRYLIKASRNANGYRASSLPDPDTAQWGTGGPLIYDVESAIENILTGYNATAFEYLSEGIWTALEAHRNSLSSFIQALQSYAEQTVIEMVHADTQLPSKTISNALAELIRQMTGSSDDVNASAPAVSAATDSGNTGDAISGATVKNVYGKNNEYLPPETIVLKATSDSGLGATLGSEPYSVEGEAQVSDSLSYLWPGGSAANNNLTALDAGGDENLLTNGTFDSFSVANTPDSWTIQVGVAGTDIFAAGSSEDYAGNNALKFTGTGGTPLSQIWQAVTLEPNTVYALAFRIKDSGAGLLAGVVNFDLYNGAAVINDDAGTANSITKAFNATTGSYVGFVTFFITPKVIPATTRLRIHVSTALTSGESVYIDHVCFAEATELYTNGPWGAVFSGATATAKNDRFTFTVTNTQGVYQEWFERWFGMRALGLQLPSDAAAGETITDPT